MRMFRTMAVLGATVAAVGGVILMPTQAQAATIIAIEYEHANWVGDSLIGYVPYDNFTCTADTAVPDWEQGSMPQGWNDRVSSYRSYAGCWQKVYEHSNWRGRTYGYAGTTSYVGSTMNDQTSSIRWS